MKLTIDFETRSRVDLKNEGLYKYALDPSTDVMCIAFAVDNHDPVLYIPPKFARFAVSGSIRYEIVSYEKLVFCAVSADIIEAHNAAFEMEIWNNVFRRDFPKLPILTTDKVRCSAAKAAFYALPRSLDESTRALGVKHLKDKEGYAIMLKMCKPRKISKNNSSEWVEDPEKFSKLCNYCASDVIAERALSEALPELPKKELEIWKHDYVINSRGIPIDVNAVKALIRKINFKENTLLEEFRNITKETVHSPRQQREYVNWLNSNSNGLLAINNIQKETVKKLISRTELPEMVRRSLTIRQELSKASVKKLTKMLAVSNSDYRARGCFMYHGASTGRYTGKHIQFQNLPRDSYLEDDIDFILNSDIDTYEYVYGGIFSGVSKCIRGMIKAENGKKFLSFDYSQIECRVLAWLANETKLLSAFKNNKDVYVTAASGLYEKKESDITKEERQIGKVATLALGYQGFIGAFQSMAKVYGVIVKDEKAKEIVMRWRASNQKIREYWRGAEYAAMQSIKNPEVVFKHGNVFFKTKNDFMKIKLPSGRCLHYYNPRIDTVDTEYEKDKAVVSYMGIGENRKWTRLFSYGGKWTENIVQATARDILTDAMLSLESEGYPVVMHVHDEVVCEVDKKLNENKFISIIQKAIPSWAEGCPISGESWQGLRYRKG